MITQDSIDQVLETLPLRYSGPGGALAILQNGKLLGQRVWGYADVAKRIHMDPDTRMPICSITKQFICALLLDLKQNPTPAMTARGTDIDAQFEDKLRETLHPDIFAAHPELSVQHLCDMQSGLRDYWAMTALWGAEPEGEFRLARQYAPMLTRTKSFQFAPGTEYSYCNVNFHVLGRVIERVAGGELGGLLRERVLAPAGMDTAVLWPSNATLPGPCIGYEGTEQTGYVAAVNNMEWSGDAGLVASLKDMIAWETHLHRLYAEGPDNWYARAASKPTTFADGTTPAMYHFGLIHEFADGVHTVGHSGALRGWRSHRRHAPEAGISVIVLLNHEASVGPAVEYAFQALLQKSAPESPIVEPTPAWEGSFLDRDTQLVVRVRPGSKRGQLVLAYAGADETLRLTDPSHGETAWMKARIDGDVLHVHRIKENRKLEARRLVSRPSSFQDASLTGDYRCEEVDSVFHCWGEAGLLYGEFDGYLGRGTATVMRYVGDDVWVLTCPRGLDAPAPGDWTVVFRRGEDGAVEGFTMGCWLARRVEFVKLKSAIHLEDI
ncbi:beta-lactamase/transpeptidase-like protein [Aspergillus saccharolyticus JOP 1030-1]|uniref:Beta-lactamase/transpeptidase-like protein n=1 Tax=Aspergillus saccharolyticus JOP 1030-1 TaxID=1450539 RepID=A0A318ZZY1_9EURO|nr:beta-lactamase/transpeptidase-like protein [Aspergillus saccharolyticus JOP 1030-1]PYH49790.1 beta-lactamase/transpeptidase-like protein [Aspergillus saccharolyticus JOP 1030-1]